jgi:hypothetical protein
MSCVFTLKSSHLLIFQVETQVILCKHSHHFAMCNFFSLFVLGLCWFGGGRTTTMRIFSDLFSPCFACVCMCKGFVIWRWRIVTTRILFHLVFFLFFVCVCAWMCLWFCDLNLEVKELQHVCMCVHAHMRGCVLRFCVFGGRSTCACF